MRAPPPLKSAASGIAGAQTGDSADGRSARPLPPAQATPVSGHAAQCTAGAHRPVPHRCLRQRDSRPLPAAKRVADRVVAHGRAHARARGRNAPSAAADRGLEVRASACRQRARAVPVLRGRDAVRRQRRRGDTRRRHASLRRGMSPRRAISDRVHAHTQ